MYQRIPRTSSLVAAKARPKIARVTRPRRQSPRAEVNSPVLPALGPITPTQCHRTDGEKFTSFIVKYTVVRDLSHRSSLRPSEPLRRANPKDICRLFVAKCDACCAFPDFRDGSGDAELRQLKFDLLSEILAALSDVSITKHLTGDHINVLFRMISVNLFRKFPFVSLVGNPEFTIDREFSHIDLVYQILASAMSFRTLPRQLVTPSCNQTFINALFLLLGSYDAREQRHVVKIFGLVAKNFEWAVPSLFRRIWRLCIQVDEDFKPLHSLPSLVSILSIFAPECIKDPQTAARFFNDVLVPLHKCDSYCAFHVTLTHLVIHVLNVDAGLIHRFVVFIARHWAVRSRQKCSLVFDELGAVCEVFAPAIDPEAAAMLLRRVADFFTDPTSEVSQQALFLISSEPMRHLIKKCPEPVIRKLYREAAAVCARHWIPDTRDWAADVMTEITTIHPAVKGAETTPDEDQRTQNWERIARAAGGKLNPL